MEKGNTARNISANTIDIQPVGTYQGDVPINSVQPPNFRGERPPSHFGIAVFTLFGTCNCLFGALAVLFASLSDKSWNAGDRNSAKRRGTIAFYFGLLGTLLSFVISLIVIVAWMASLNYFNVAVGAVALLVFSNITIHFLIYAVKCESVQDMFDFNKFVLKN